jgi:uncharacterized membrane protein HdeD (DUF308 family)
MSSTIQSGGQDLKAVLSQSIRRHWRLLLVEGIVLVVLGFGAIFVPPIAGLAATIFLGWLFLVGGFVGLVATLAARQAPGFWWALLSAVVALVAGGILLWNPLQGLVTLTYVLIAYFFVDGVLMIALAFAHRRELSGRWEWLMLNGAIDIVLALIILAGLPGAFAWALGLLVGIDLVFGGASLIAMALSARSAVA